MISHHLKQKFYRALLEKNKEYEGQFFVGVTTTGIFCRPTCPARKPKFEHCEFYKTAQEALYASFRPCKRCRPLMYPDHISPLIHSIIKKIEASPEKRWKEADFKNLSTNISTARRQFKKRFGMTFIQYARARRMGIAMKLIRQGTSVIETQCDVGYESSSGFRDAFTKIMGAAPTKFNKNYIILKSCWIDTPLGSMIAIANEQFLYLLEFVDRRGLELEIERLRFKMKAAIIPGNSPILDQLQRELKCYFDGTLQAFKTPLYMMGSEFQKLVWLELIKIPYGTTQSYLDLARKIGNVKSTRAVTNANGKNQIAIIIPCHRVIRENGEIGGYGGGIYRKQWLIDHEKNSFLKHT